MGTRGSAAGRTTFPELIPLWVAVFIDILGFTILIPFLPFFMAEFDTTPLVIGLLLSTNAVFGLVCGPLFGKWSDRIGRKTPLLVAQAGTCLGFLILAASNSLALLFVSRIVDGLFGGNFPLAKAVIGDVVPPKERSKQMSNVGVAYVLAGLFGPGLGGILSRYGLWAPGLAAALLSALTFGLTWLFLKESLPPENRTTSSRRQVPTHDRPPAIHLLENKEIKVLLILWAFHTLSFTIYNTSISLFAGIHLGMDAEEMGFLLMYAGIFRVFVRFVIFEPFLRHFGDYATMVVGLVCFVAAFLAFGWVVNSQQFLAVLLIVSFAASCVRGVVTGFLSRAAGPRAQGIVSGTSSSLDSASQVVGPIVGGFFLGTVSANAFGWLLALIALAALVIGLKPLTIYKEKFADDPTPRVEPID
jgi:predicted MFS family arabinose efflux permease